MEVTMFVQQSCPYCIKARKYLDELRAEDPRYAKVQVRIVDELRERALADSYDYYYVPTFYLGQAKLHEGAAEKADVKAVLEAALKG